MLSIKLSDHYSPPVAIDRTTGYKALLFCALAFPALYIVSRYNYNLFHSLADIFTIVIASTVFVVAWNSRESIDNDYLLYAGIAFLSFTFLDLFHLLGNKNMGVFPQYGNLGPELYIASRYVLSLSLLIAPLFINRKLRVAPVFAAYSLATLLVLLSIFYWQNFPVCFVEGVGLTPFKVISDYIICFILLAALVLLLLNRRSFDARVLRLLAASIFFSIATGLAFTLYADPFGVMNAVGHFFQIISFYLIYLAVIETGLTKPQNILFRKLKESEGRLVRVLESMPDAFVSFDADLRYTYVNANAERLQAAQREDLLGKDIQAVYPDPESYKTISLYERVIRDQEPVTLTSYHAGFDRWVEVRAFPTPDGVSVFYKDVSENVKADKALRESEERLRRIAQAARVGFFEWNTADGMAYWSPEHYELLGYEAGSQVSWERWLQGVHPEDRGRVEANAARLLERGRAQGQVRDHKDEYRFVRPDGTVIWLESDLSLDMVGGEAVVRGSIRDVSARKRAEAELEQIRNTFEEAQRIAHLGSFDYVAATRTTVWSEEEYRIYGLDPAGPSPAYDVMLAQYIHPDDAALLHETFTKAMQTGVIYDLEHRIVRPDGSVRWVYDRAHPYFDQNGTFLRYIGATLDITERKQMEDELRKSKEELEVRVQERTAELEQSKEQLQVLASQILTAQENERKRIALEIHDVLGSSLSAIKFKAEEALSCLPGEGTGDKPITQPLKTLIPLIRDTIDEARRIQNDLRPPLLDDLGIIPTFSWFCRRFKTIYSGIEVEQAIDIHEEEIPDYLKIVFFRITQEAMNNIGKYAKADRVYLSLQKVDSTIDLGIRDNGEGFDLEALSSRDSSKKGMGLSSMKERVEISGGSFSIETAKEKGTVIRAVWPV